MFIYYYPKTHKYMKRMNMKRTIRKRHGYEDRDLR